jgi:hypothetical protein
MEAARFFETSEQLYNPTRCNNADDDLWNLCTAFQDKTEHFLLPFTSVIDPRFLSNRRASSYFALLNDMTNIFSVNSCLYINPLEPEIQQNKFVQYTKCDLYNKKTIQLKRRRKYSLSPLRTKCNTVNETHISLLNVKISCAVLKKCDPKNVMAVTVTWTRLLQS